MFLRSFMPHYPQPDADALENLSMAVVVDQKRLGGGACGTLTAKYASSAGIAIRPRRAWSS